MLHDFYNDGSTVAGPPPANAYKRAVCRRPPAHFEVEVLPPQKLGSSHAYGMRICPTQPNSNGNHLDHVGDGRSTRSDGSQNEEYVIWRRWDDCLWFQESLELEYTIQSREKRRRLSQGKGVKKNGVYLSSDMASSFESLPPGPDPATIARDVHEFLPRLTKKGTLFRASQSTVELRHKQFEALILALLQEEVPVLIRELREQRNIRDFFGYWRRDKDFERKAGDDKRLSVMGAADGQLSHFSASTLSLQLPSASPASKLSPTSKHFSTSRYSPPSPIHTQIRDSVLLIPEFFSSGSKRRNSGYPDPEPVSPVSLTQPKSAPAGYGRGGSGRAYKFKTNSGENSPVSSGSDIPAKFAWKLHVSPSNRQSRSSTLLAFPSSPTVQEHELSFELSRGDISAVPEDGDLATPMSKLDVGGRPRVGIRRLHSPSATDKQNRNCVLFTQTPPQSPPAQEVPNTWNKAEAPTLVPSNTITSSRYSSQLSVPLPRCSSLHTLAVDVPLRPSSSASWYASSYTEMDRPDTPGSILSPLLGDGEPVFSRYRTDSLASINSVMTGSSVDRILPRNISANPPRRSFSVGSRTTPRRYTQAMTVPEGKPWVQPEDDILDAFLYDGLSSSLQSDSSIASSLLTPHTSPKCLQIKIPDQFPWTLSPPSPPLQSPLLPTFTTGGVSETFSVKAALEDSIIVFRALVGVSYLDIRQKLYDKYVQQEGMPISGAFKIGYLQPRFLSDWNPSRGRDRVNSNSVSCIDASDPLLKYISSEDEWQDAVGSCGGKLNLRILDWFL